MPYNVGAAVFAGPALLILAVAVRSYGIWSAFAVYALACVVVVAAAYALRLQPRFLGVGNAARSGANDLAALRARRTSAV